MKPDGGLLELREGEGEDCDDLAPLTDAWTVGGGGRFIFWWGGAGLVAIAVAILIFSTFRGMRLLPICLSQSRNLARNPRSPTGSDYCLTTITATCENDGQELAYSAAVKTAETLRSSPGIIGRMS